MDRKFRGTLLPLYIAKLVSIYFLDFWPPLGGSFSAGFRQSPASFCRGRQKLWPLSAGGNVPAEICGTLFLAEVVGRGFWAVCGAGGGSGGAERTRFDRASKALQDGVFRGGERHGRSADSAENWSKKRAFD